MAKKGDMVVHKARNYHQLAGCYVACNKAAYIQTQFNATLRFDLMPIELKQEIRKSVARSYVDSTTQEGAVIIQALCKQLGMRHMSYVGKMKAWVFLPAPALAEFRAEVKVLRDMLSLDYEIRTRDLQGVPYVELYAKAEMKEKETDGWGTRKRAVPVVKPQFAGLTGLLEKYLQSPEEQEHRHVLRHVVNNTESIQLVMRDYI